MRPLHTLTRDEEDLGGMTIVGEKTKDQVQKHRERKAFRIDKLQSLPLRSQQTLVMQCDENQEKGEVWHQEPQNKLPILGWGSRRRCQGILKMIVPRMS